MTKKEIVRKISEDVGLPLLSTREIVQRTFNAITQTLVNDGRIELRNFGVFEVRRKAPRKARNPRTGDTVYVPAKLVVTFKPGREMEALIQKLDRTAPPEPTDRIAASAEDASEQAPPAHEVDGPLRDGPFPGAALPASDVDDMDDVDGTHEPH